MSESAVATTRQLDPCRARASRGALRCTPGLLLGPYYPAKPPDDADERLWCAATVPANIRGLRVDVRVIDSQGRDIVDALVEMWQADPRGCYRHPAAARTGIASEFRGYGRALSDSGGACSFVSVVPGSYDAEGHARAPHLHVQITAAATRLVTQIFLPDDPLNSRDRWFACVSHPELLTAAARHDEAQALHVVWTAVLPACAQS